MLKGTKFHLATPDNQVQKMFENKGLIHEEDYDEPFDCLVFVGGADITPFLYGEIKLKKTVCDFSRDLLEIKKFKGVKKTFPKIGICRGAQFLNVMAGGSMYQHVDNHSGFHEIKDLWYDRVYKVTSTHHQMMIPSSDATLLFAANRSTRRESASDVVIRNHSTDKEWDDPEVVVYYDYNALCFQPHPEYKDLVTQDLFWELVETHVSFKTETKQLN